MPSPSNPAPPQTPDFLLVLPAYRELSRLPRYLACLVEALASAPWGTEILVVDDGSPAPEQEALSREVIPGQHGRCLVLPLMPLSTNRLKGDAILEGWLSHPARWLAFADSDGATGASEVLRVLGEIAAGDPSLGAAYFGVRRATASNGASRTAMRRLLSWAFSRLAGLAARAKPIDFQCGFKVIPGHVLPRIAGKLGNRGLCFDVSLFLALRSEGVPVRPVPVDWHEVPGGKISPWRDGPGMIAGLCSLAFRGLDGKKHA